MGMDGASPTAFSTRHEAGYLQRMGSGNGYELGWVSPVNLHLTKTTQV